MRFSRSNSIRRTSGSSDQSQTTFNTQLARCSSSDGPLRSPSPQPSFAAGSSTGSFLSSHSESSQQGGHPLTQAVTKFRSQRMRPLSMFSSQSSSSRSVRLFHFRRSSESIESEQFQVVPNLNKRRSYLRPSAGQKRNNFHQDSNQTTNILQTQSSMPEISSSEMFQYRRSIWRSNISNSAPDIDSSRENLAVREKEEDTWHDEMLDTLHTLRRTADEMKKPRKHLSNTNQLARRDSLPTFGSALKDMNTLSRSASAVSKALQIDEDKAASPAICLSNSTPSRNYLSPATHLSKRLTRPSILPSNYHLPGKYGLIPQDLARIKREDDTDDGSSFCTLSDEEAEYQSHPYVLPIWPNPPPSLCLPFGDAC